ncbi:MAG TPA: bifunctional demethylmenaquinone methyltransferase/2-methoxy-6-polyprenyl-1,4-benzoquinol methylase UbiE [Vicinamibacterales bacterium]|nr:bifunctional demethylmenaquinone methyltransferase/2-methoxy-6-polyprenyl-1,4-benzoquinol methylase UbiE [Vicinamibacterales bacterium]
MPAASAPAKESARISGMFDAIAGRYDLLNHLLSVGLDKQWRKRAVTALQLTGRETVLDLCTGTADLALAAMSAAQPARRVIGIDFSAAMLQIGKDKVRRAGPIGPAGVVLIRGDATHIPLNDATVDAVTIGFGIRNVEQPMEACREIVRVLRPGGRLVILEFSLPRSTVLRNFYLWYFRRVLPLIGRLISKHPSAYTYLPESVEAFPSAEAFADQLRSAGFGTVRAIPMTFGVVYMFVALKGHRS